MFVMFETESGKVAINPRRVVDVRERERGSEINYAGSGGRQLSIVSREDFAIVTSRLSFGESGVSERFTGD